MAAPSYTQSRGVTALQVTFQSADKTKALAGKVAYSDGRQVQYDKSRNEYFVVATINGEAKKILENYWIVQDNTTKLYSIWDPTSFAGQHV